jgi:hypothetical protein
MIEQLLQRKQLVRTVEAQARVLGSRTTQSGRIRVDARSVEVSPKGNDSGILVKRYFGGALLVTWPSASYNVTRVEGMRRATIAEIRRALNTLDIE